MKITAATVVFFMIFARAYSQQFISEQELRRMIPKDITHYLDWLASSDPVKRVQAGNILAEMGKKAFYAVPFLLRYSNNSEEIVMQRTTPMGRPTGDPTVVTVGFSLRTSAEFMLTKVGEEDTSFSFIKNVLLRDDYYKSQEVSAEILYSLYSQRNYDPALELLFSVIKSKKFRSLDILESMGFKKERRAVPHILEACKNRDDLSFLCASARALGDIGDTLAVDFLINILNDKGLLEQRVFGEEHNPNYNLKQIAIEALGKMENPKAVRQLFYLNIKEKEVEYRVEANKLLRKAQRSSSAFDLFSLALKDTCAEVKGMAMRWLGGIRDPRVPDFLASALNDTSQKIKEEIAFSLAYQGDSRAIAPLNSIFMNPSNKSTWPKENVLIHLEMINNQLAVDLIIKALKNENHEVSRRAASILSKKKSPLSIIPLLTWVATAPNEDNYWKEMVLDSLRTLKDRQTIDTLVGLLRDKNKIVKLNAEILLKDITEQQIHGAKVWERWLKKETNKTSSPER